MASIEKDEKSGIWTARFRFPVGGKTVKYNRSLKTKDERIAEQGKARIEETISLIENGRLALPDGITEKEVATFVMSGGKLTKKPSAIRTVPLEKLWKDYVEAYSLGKEEDSVGTEETHKKNLVRILGNVDIQTITTDLLQNYVVKRSEENGLRGKNVQPSTLQKELQTFRALWDVAIIKEYVKRSHPTVGVVLPKSSSKPPFKTWDQIEEIINYGGLTEDQIKEQWECLFLREEEILNLLEIVKSNANHQFIYPAFSFAAFTGARRAEIMRSERSDFWFDKMKVMIRQKKRDREKSMTFREVALHPRLAQIMKEWFKCHPGGIYTIAAPAPIIRSENRPDKPISADQMRCHFSRTLKGSKWEVLRGWHVFRHSFASNCARNNIQEAVIDEWMGHSPDSEVRLRYRHLFPEDTSSSMQRLFS